MKVTIRTKPIQGGKIRIYLDYYPAITNPDTGKQTRREFLDLYLYSEIEYKEETYTTGNNNIAVRILTELDSKGNPKKVKLDALQKTHNRETLQLAENIKAQRQLQIQKEDYGFITIDKKADFLAFFKKIADEANAKGNTNFLASYNHLKEYCNNYCPVEKLTVPFCEGFKEYLTTAKPQVSTRDLLTNNSMRAYFNLFKMVVKKASKASIIKENNAEKVPGIAFKDVQREYLTYDELKAAANAPCGLAVLKQAAIFSAMTGLRFSDIKKLTWGELSESNGNYRIDFTNKKTKHFQNHHISAEAYKLLGERKAPKELVFQDLAYGGWQNTILSKWIHGAGINKHITFHCFRHTYATLQLTLGTDIYTVSKLLGHANVGMTQIYAKVIDSKKQEAANKISLA